MSAVHQYSRRELEDFAASRGATVSRRARIGERAEHLGREEREAALAAVREAASALRWADAHPEDAGEEVSLTLRRILKDSLQDAGQEAVPWVEWKRGWDLWATSWLGPEWQPLPRDSRYYPD